MVTRLKYIGNKEDAISNNQLEFITFEVVEICIHRKSPCSVRVNHKLKIRANFTFY